MAPDKRVNCPVGHLHDLVRTELSALIQALWSTGSALMCVGRDDDYPRPVTPDGIHMSIQLSLVMVIYVKGVTKGMEGS